MNNFVSMFDPDFVIDCKDLKTSTEIYDIMRSYNNVKNYCYAICYRRGLLIDYIKFGESAPNPGSNTAEAIGERIKRQLEHVPGWDDKAYYSAHGNDFWSNVNREIQLGNLPVIDKDNLIIGVWNLDIRTPTFIYETNKELSRIAEGELTQQYKDLHDGRLPILNIKDPTSNREFKRPKLPTTLWSIG